MDWSGAARAAWWIVCAATVSCARGEPPPPALTSDVMRLERPCPLGVPGAQIELTDAPGGVDMTFTSGPAHVDELRRRVAEIAAGGVRPAALFGGAPAFDASTENVFGGVRLHVVAKDPMNLAPLRARVSARAADVQARPCNR